jgi:hypothetical protein
MQFSYGTTGKYLNDGGSGLDNTVFRYVRELTAHRFAVSARKALFIKKEEEGKALGKDIVLPELCPFCVPFIRSTTTQFDVNRVHAL